MKKLALLTLVTLCVASCIPNDVPYPYTVASIASMQVDGAEKVEINTGTAMVTVTLVDTTDIQNVAIIEANVNPEKITQVLTTDGKPMSLVGSYDMRVPLDVVLRPYPEQDYKWRIQAVQTIERFFSVNGQVGSSFIDYENKRAIAYVSKNTILADVTVQELVLEPEEITTYSKDKSEIHNFLSPVTIDVTCHGRTETWTLYVEQTETSVALKSLDAWTTVAYLSASGIDGEDRGFRYRRKGDSEWMEVPQSSIVFNAGDFSTCIEELEPLAEYECYAYSGEEQTEPQEFTMDAADLLPNGSFEVYSHAESQKYFSFFDPKNFLWNRKWWDSGNIGSTSVGETASICNPDLIDKVDGECSARLNSRYVVVKFAAGNIFTGEFAELVGTAGGKVNFGRPYTLRPRSLKFALKYQPGSVDYVNGAPAGDPVKIGDPDRCQIFIALGDWDYRQYGGTSESPVQVNTTVQSTFFNPKGPNVIAYGTYITNQNTGGWIDVEIPLDYVSVSRKPTHIIISCAASMLGDYFTGSSSSTLWLDRMELVY